MRQHTSRGPRQTTGMVRARLQEEKVKPDPSHITLRDNISNIKKMLMELILHPRRDLAKWADFTKQTPNIKIGYPGQHLASLVTGVEGARSGARGHDLCDGSEVKSCSRVDQLDKCKNCKAAVARIERANVPNANLLISSATMTRSGCSQSRATENSKHYLTRFRELYS